MSSFNRVILMGNLTRDPEVRALQSGMSVCDIGLAVNDRRKNAQGEWVDETTFVDVTLWGRTAEIAGEYLRKGAPALIEGRLKLEQWESDGQKRSKLKVVGETLQLLGKKGDSGDAEPQRQQAPQRQQQSRQTSAKPASQPKQRQTAAAGFESGADDDIPF